MRLCRCDPGPVHDRGELRCKTCGEWAAHGQPLEPWRIGRLSGEVRSLTGRIGTDLRYAVEVAYGLASTGASNGVRSAPGPSDPTSSRVLGRRAVVADWASLSSRLAERALVYLRLADEAAGMALFVAEPDRGGTDHVKAAWHDPAALYSGRPDLAEAHEAQQRRRKRGEL